MCHIAFYRRTLELKSGLGVSLSCCSKTIDNTINGIPLRAQVPKIGASGALTPCYLGTRTLKVLYLLRALKSMTLSTLYLGNYGTMVY